MGLGALDLIKSDPSALCDLNKLALLKDPFAEDSINSSSAQSQPSQEQQVLLPCWPAALEPSMTEYHLDGHTILDLSWDSWGKLVPFSPALKWRAWTLARCPLCLSSRKRDMLPCPCHRE